MYDGWINFLTIDIWNMNNNMPSIGELRNNMDDTVIYLLGAFMIWEEEEGMLCITKITNINLKYY